jgi:NADH dehydrogenase FAD-containing subunit
LPLTGVRPNTSFLPEQWIGGNGNVKVNRHLKVEGSKNVYAINDCSNLEGKHLFVVETQFSYLAEELDAVLTDKQGAAKEYVVDSSVRQFVTLGKNTGLSQMNNWKVFGFLLGLMKGRTLLVESAPKLVEGKQVIRTKV